MDAWRQVLVVCVHWAHSSDLVALYRGAFEREQIAFCDLCRLTDHHFRQLGVRSEHQVQLVQDLARLEPHTVLKGYGSGASGYALLYYAQGRTQRQRPAEAAELQTATGPLRTSDWRSRSAWGC
jgi:hypothetical protein